MTRGQLLKSMSSSELSQWIALENLSGWKERTDKKKVERNAKTKTAALKSLLFGIVKKVKDG